MKDGLISASDKKNSNMKKSLFNILVLFSTIALFSCESKDCWLLQTILRTQLIGAVLPPCGQIPVTK